MTIIYYFFVLWTRNLNNIIITVSYASSDSVELLLDYNLPWDTAWISLEDFKDAGGIEEEYGEIGNNKYGPIAVLKHLKNVTDSWNGVVTLTSQNEDMEITDVYELAVYWTDSEKDWYPVGV